MEEVLVGKKYRHYKGKEYEVLAVGKHTETLEQLVIYRALYGEGDVWVRPYDMFVERLEVNGEDVPRFMPVQD